MESTSSSDHDRLIRVGESAEPEFELQVDELPISRVREGMEVIDAGGKKIGDVERVHLGDPEAITNAGQERPDSRPGLADALLSVFTDSSPDMPESIRNRLIHDGFIKVDGGLLGPTRYALAGQIASVSGDTVRLTARADELIEP